LLELGCSEARRIIDTAPLIAMGPLELARIDPRRPWPIAASLILHLLLLVALALLTVARPATAPAVHSVDVQIISGQDYKTLLAPPPPAVPPPILVTPAPRAAELAPPTAIPQPATPKSPSPKAQPVTPADGMTEATTLFSTGLLNEVASTEVRKTLPTLDPYERMTQLCNIEATEQIRSAVHGSNPETIAASAFAETMLKDGVLSAPGAAYRSHHTWFFMQYACAVRPDFAGVASFRFSLGAPVPRDQWDSHDLIAVDADDEGSGG
jgi:hypothetical protein